MNGIVFPLHSNSDPNHRIAAINSMAEVLTAQVETADTSKALLIEIRNILRDVLVELRKTGRNPDAGK